MFPRSIERSGGITASFIALGCGEVLRSRVVVVAVLGAKARAANEVGKL